RMSFGQNRLKRSAPREASKRPEQLDPYWWEFRACGSCHSLWVSLPAGSCSACTCLREAPVEYLRETSRRLGSRWIENSLHQYPATRHWPLLLDTPLLRSLSL